MLSNNSKEGGKENVEDGNEDDEDEEEDEEEKKLKCHNLSTESMQQPYPSSLKAQVAFSEKFGEYKVLKRFVFPQVCHRDRVWRKRSGDEL